MKINKRLNRITLQDKDIETIISYEGYICINFYYIVKKELINFENALIQDRINKDESFGYNLKTNYELNLKNWDIKQFLNLKEGQPIRKTDFYFTAKYLDTVRIYNNLETKKTVLLNSDFAKILDTIEGNITQNDSYTTPALLVHKNNELQAVFMPIKSAIYDDAFNQLLTDIKVA